MKIWGEATTMMTVEEDNLPNFPPGSTFEKLKQKGQIKLKGKRIGNDNIQCIYYQRSAQYGQNDQLCFNCTEDASNKV